MGIFDTTNNNPNLPTVLIVDGNSLGSRAYFVNPFEFFNMVQSVLTQIKAEHLVVCFDNGQHNFRKGIYPGYKGNRKEDNGREQYINRLWGSLLKTGISCVDAPEGDDAVASAARKLKDSFNIYILSGDGDFLYFADTYNVIVYGSSFKQRQIANTNYVVNKYGVRPDQLYDYKSLVGESGDNIPGCKGLGPVAAVVLLEEYGNLDTIYQNLDNTKYGKRLREGKEMVDISRLLVQMKEDLPVSFSADTKFNGFQESVKELRKCL